MMNIKEYVMNDAVDGEVDLATGIRISNITVEVVEMVDGQEYCIDHVKVPFRINQFENKTEQEIKSLIANRVFTIFYYSGTVPDNARLYLCIDDKRYLLAGEYMPELYY